MKVVPGIRFRPSGPDLGLLAPTHVGPVLQPANPPMICLRKVLVLMSMTSTDLLFRSVKYIRPLALSTSLMSKEKFVPALTFGTAIRALSTPIKLLPPPPPPSQPPSNRVAATATPTIKRLIMSVLLMSISDMDASLRGSIVLVRNAKAMPTNPSRADRAQTGASPAHCYQLCGDRIVGRFSTPINAARSCLASQPFPFRVGNLARSGPYAY